MSTTFFEKSAGAKTAFNPLGVKGIDHIEFIVDNADQWRDFFLEKYGMAARFYADEKTGVRGRRAHVVGQGRINFIVAEPAGTGPEADFMRWHLAKHGMKSRIKKNDFERSERRSRGRIAFEASLKVTVDGIKRVFHD